MPTLIRASLLGALALTAVLAAIFIVKAVVALASVVLIALVAVAIFGWTYRAVRRFGQRSSLTIRG